jgi:hypothetical protein
VVLSPGGVGATAAAAVAVGLRLSRRVGIEATALFPVTTPRLEIDQGSIRVAVTLVGAGAYWRLAGGARWALEAAGGVLVASVHADGTGSGANIGLDTSLIGVAPYARAGATLALTPWLAARADLIGGAVVRRVNISFSDTGMYHNIATWGRPLVSALIGLQAGWP